VSDDALRRFVVLVVVSVWAISFIADLFLPAYDPSPFVHVAMMAVVGAILTDAHLRRRE
jgi:hypothetical protein